MEEIATSDVEKLNRSEPSTEWDNTSGFHCDLCNDKGVFYYQIDGEVLFKPCKCNKARRSYKRLKESGLYTQSQEMTFNNFNRDTQAQKDLYQLVADYLKDLLHNDSKSWLYISGQSGGGKTHLCTALATALIKRGYDVGYMLWKKHGDDLKATVGKDPDRYKELITPFLECEVLYIDDFLKTGHSDTGAVLPPTTGDINLAIKIIFDRAESRKPTIISCEFPINSILEFDEATGGRILENAKNYNVFIPYGKENNYRYNFIK